MKNKIIYPILVLVFFGMMIFIFDKNRKNGDTYIFSQIYQNNLWGGGSGSGSNPKNARPYLKILQSFFYDKNIKKIVDLGCGDWRLMETIYIPDDKQYKGFDVVSMIIEKANLKFKKSNVEFYQINKLEDIKNETGDLLIVKDVMQHWSYERIGYFVNNILPNFKWAFVNK